MNYCVVDSLGYYTGSSNGFCIGANTSALEINHTTVRQSLREGIRVQTFFSPIIRNCVLEDNNYAGINILDNADPVIDSCRFYNNANQDIRTYFEGVGQMGDLDSLTVSIVSSTIDQLRRCPAWGILENIYWKTR